MGTLKLTTLLLLGSLLAATVARSQEPPPYAGNEQEPPAIESATNDPNDPGAAGAASVDYFHQQLAPYGQWVTHEGSGEVWVPQVAAGWRPYTTGRWASTDQGLAWMADEPWGWAPFHYGRWAYGQDIGGWYWTPGSVWAPAWVAWRHGGGYLGWAPLPPSVGFTADAGLAETDAITPGFYTFVPEGRIVDERIATVIVPSARNGVIVREAANVTRYSVVGNRIVNSGLDGRRIEQIVGHPVPQVRVSALAAAGAKGRGAFYQPAVVTKAARATAAEFGKVPPRQGSAARLGPSGGSSRENAADSNARSREDRRVTTPATGSRTSRETSERRAVQGRTTTTSPQTAKPTTPQTVAPKSQPQTQKAAPTAAQKAKDEKERKPPA